MFNSHFAIIDTLGCLRLLIVVFVVMSLCNFESGVLLTLLSSSALYLS